MAIFGYYLPWRGGDDAAGLFLFQLSPFHDVFRSNGDHPGWAMENGKAILGQRDNVVELVLTRNLTRANILNDFSANRGTSIQGNLMEGGLAGRGRGRRN